MLNPDNKEALVVVPDFQLSLAIGKEGQNARLLQNLQDLRLILRVSHRQKKKESSIYSMMMNIMMTNTTMMNTMQNMMTSIMMMNMIQSQRLIQKNLKK